MKYLIVGLGNPGIQYQETRHNIGFQILDALAFKSEKSFAPDRYADLAKIKYRSRSLTLIKPSTFMNLSGKAVNYWIQKLKINIENLLIINDDIALNFGELRIRAKGSDGGHNGLKNINEALQATKYARLRFGIGNNFYKGGQAEYVLEKWNDEEKQNLEKRIKQAVLAIESFCTNGVDLTMSMYNGK